MFGQEGKNFSIKPLLDLFQHQYFKFFFLIPATNTLDSFYFFIKLSLWQNLQYATVNPLGAIGYLTKVQNYNWFCPHFKIMTAAADLRSFSLTTRNRVAAVAPILPLWKRAAFKLPPHMPIIPHTYLLKLSRLHVMEGGQAMCSWAELWRSKSGSHFIPSHEQGYFILLP